MSDTESGQGSSEGLKYNLQQLLRAMGRVVAVGVGLDTERPPARELLGALAHEFLQRHAGFLRGT